MNYFVALDVETGGTDPDIHALMEVGIVVIDPSTFAILDQYESYINKYEAIYDPEAIKVNRITDTKLQSGRSYQTVYNDVKGLLEKYNSRPNTSQQNDAKFNDRFLPIVIAHNALFDLSFLEVMFEKNADNLYRYIRPCYVDTMTWAAGISPLESQGLKQLAQTMGVSYSNGHTALHDAQVAAKIAIIGWQRMRNCAQTSIPNVEVLKFNM